jgi:FkbM family methyltransferase
MRRVWFSVPLRWYDPFRRGVVAFRRGSLPRKICVAVLKQAQKAYRGRLVSCLNAVIPLDFPDLCFAPADSMVIETVYWFGVRGYEGLVADTWIEQCRNAKSILEIGGNIGLFTVIGAMASDARYTVAEPVPTVAEHLRQNLSLNSITHVELLEAAMIPADSPADVALLVPHEQHDIPVGAHLTIGTEIAPHVGTRRIVVPGLPLREYVIGRDLIKIDAEGIEVDLLRAVHDILIRDKPNLLIEVLPSSPELAAFLVSLAKEAGYALVILPEWGSDHPVTVSPDNFSLSMMTRNNSKDLLLVQPK